MSHSLSSAAFVASDLRVKSGKPNLQSLGKPREISDYKIMA